MVNVTVSLPDDVASRVAAAAADRGVTVEELASEAVEAYLQPESASNGSRFRGARRRGDRILGA